MQLTVLGSAAGGGFPQWNCNCRQCDGLRRGTLRAKARTQSSIFVRPDGQPHGVLLNASPDILQQVRERADVMQPARGIRDTAIAAVLLIDGQVDHATGLYMLRERRTPLPLWCTAQVEDDLTNGNPIFRVLSHYCGVQVNRIHPDGRAFTIDDVPGLRWRAFAVDGQPAPYSPRRGAAVPGDNIGLVIEDIAAGTRVFYAPGLAAVPPPLFDTMAACDAVLVDGTFWRDDEMISMGLSAKTAHSIGHLAQQGTDGQPGMLDWLEKLPARTRKLLIHINNTNPILDEDSPERAELARRGIEACEDGLQLQLSKR